MSQRRLTTKLSRTFSTALAMQGLTRGLNRLQQPVSDPHRWGVEIDRDIPYLPGSEHHTLDIYRPRGRTDTLPVLLYVHGGGFHMLSKATHWPLAVAFARQGYLVASVDYRLAPQHPYPAAIADVCAAATWVHRHIEGWGGDPHRVVLAGESAGANLVTALTIASTWERPELYARTVFESGFAPQATIAACGLLQVSDPGRFRRKKRLPRWIDHYIHVVCGAYLDGRTALRRRASLADPLLVLERSPAPQRRLPPFFAFVGTRDPLLDDTRRLAAAVRRHGGTCDDRYYEGGIHAFHVLLYQRIARQCWTDQFDFLQRRLADLPASETLSLLDLEPVEIR